MGKIKWDETGNRRFETGVDKVVLYLLRYGRYSNGVPWNGITSINESSEGAEAAPFYADDIKYLNLMSNEEFKATIEAYTYPDEFKSCIGEMALAGGLFIGQQKRSHFGVCYRTLVGNDEQGSDADYKIHIIFDCIASPSEKSYSTTNESPEPITYSWEISTAPVLVPENKPTSTLILDSSKFRQAGAYNVLKKIEGFLYGTDSTPPQIPKFSDITDLYILELYLRDSANDELLDSSGESIQSRVFD